MTVFRESRRAIAKVGPGFMDMSYMSVMQAHHSTRLAKIGNKMAVYLCVLHFPYLHAGNHHAKCLRRIAGFLFTTDSIRAELNIHSTLLSSPMFNL